MMNQKERQTRFDNVAKELGKELATTVCKLQFLNVRNRQEDMIGAIAEEAMKHLPKVSRDEMVDSIVDTLRDGIYAAMNDAIREAKRTGDYNNNVLVDAFDRLKEEMDDWTDEE